MADGEAAERNMIITCVAGGTAVVAGGVLYWLGMRRDAAERKSLTVTPQAGPGGFGLVIDGRF